MRRLILSLALFLLTLPLRASQVFISEYIEGSSYNKALEMYNGSAASINLADYRFGLASNGAATPTYYTFSGTLAAGQVFVVCHASAAAGILAVADVTSSGFANWNGDDFVGLFQMVSGSPVLIDAIGVLDEDPGSAWSVAGDASGTVNHTLRRKATVTQGTTTWSASAGTNADNSEWIVEPEDTWSDLGGHNSAVNQPPVVTGLSRSPLAPLAGQAVTVSANLTDDGSVASATLRYQLDSGAWQSLALTAGTPPSYSGVIPGQVAGVQVDYEVLAVDNLGLSTTGGPDGYLVAAVSTPVILDVAHAPVVPTNSQSASVSASITDDGSVASARVLYQVDGGPELQVAMAAGSPPLWSASIPAQADGSQVAYDVEATDNEGHTSLVAGPGYTVDDSPPPPQQEPPVFTESLLDLGAVSTASTGSATAHLHNPGEVELVVESLTAVGIPFTCNPSSVVIPAGQTVAVTVQIQPPHNLRYTGWLVASGTWGAVALPLEADGDYPGSTWDSTFNLSGESLKSQLNSLILNHTSISYDAARLAMFSDIDNVNGWVECVYTGLDVQTSGIPDNTVMNTEHTWPQSYGAEGVARSDLHHLFPTSSWINNSRGNLPFGEVVVSSSGYPIGGADRGTNATGQTVFEPRDVHKGDCARSVMYFALRYGNLVSFLDLAGQETVLRSWHQSDPVSTKEVNRNNDIAALQVKRNPFIDQPGLLLRLATLDGGNANLPAAPAQAALYPDQLELVCEGQALTATMWLGNPGGTALSLSGINTTDPSCVQPGSLPASLQAGSAVAVPVTISGPCDGQATLTVNTGLGSFQVPITWSWIAPQPLDPPVVVISRLGAAHLLDWEDVASALSYRVEMANALNGPWSPLSTVTESQLLLEGESWPATSLYRVISQ